MDGRYGEALRGFQGAVQVLQRRCIVAASVSRNRPLAEDDSATALAMPVTR
jgi:hypothetical protein